MTEARQHETVDHVRGQRQKISGPNPQSSDMVKEGASELGRSRTNLVSLPQEILDLVLENVRGHNKVCWNR